MVTPNSTEAIASFAAMALQDPNTAATLFAQLGVIPEGVTGIEGVEALQASGVQSVGPQAPSTPGKSSLGSIGQALQFARPTPGIRPGLSQPRVASGGSTGNQGIAQILALLQGSSGAPATPSLGQLLSGR